MKSLKQFRAFLRTLVIIIAVLPSVENCPAQVLPFQYYSIADGLVSNRVNCMFQDSKGYIWIGTGEGISVFDGRTFSNYSMDDGLSFNYINSITESPDHKKIWIGTGDGVTKFEDGKFTAFHFSGEQALGVTEVIVDPDNNVWCCSNFGLFQYNGDVFKKFLTPISLRYAVSPVIDGDGTFWFVSEDTLHYILKNTDEVQQFSDPLFIHDSLFGASVDREGDVWISSQQSLARLYHISHGKLIHHLTSSTVKLGNGLDDGRGRMLFLSWEGIVSLSRSDPSFESMFLINDKNGLKDNAANPGIVDTEENLWFFGGNFGIAVLTDRNVLRIPMEIQSYGINNKVAAQDMHGRMWIATGEELIEAWKTGEGSWEMYSHKEILSFIGNFPSAIAFDNEGNLYCKSWESDLGKFKVNFHEGGHSTLSVERVIKRGRDFPDFGLVTFMVDSKSRVWASIQIFGIAVFDLKQKQALIKRYTIDDSIPGASVRSVAEDNQGNIWLGGFDRGLTKISSPLTSKESLKRITLENGLPDERIRSFCQLPDTSFIVGSRYRGIAIMKEMSFVEIGVKQGLASNAVWCLASDSTGRVVIGTENGAQILQTANGIHLNKKIYGKGEHILSCGIADGGDLWFVSSAGLTIVHGINKIKNDVPPPVYIRSVRVNDRNVNVNQVLNLPYDQNHIDIDFTGVHFKDPGSLQYEYRLRNEEMAWSQPIRNFSVTYAQLLPGTYTFEVRALTGDGVRSTTPATFSFAIASPFWKTWWFILSVNIAIIGLVAFGYKYRLQQLLKIERLRTRISADLHDEIASNLSSIAMFSKIIEEESQSPSTLPPHHQNLLSRISALSQESVQSIRDIIWAIDPKQETLESLLTRFGDTALALCRAKHIQLHFQMPKAGEIVTGDLAPEVRKNLWLIVKEALNNAIKHSHCHSISITYKFEHPMFTIVIEDDGEGIDEKKSSKGKGLTTMKMRAKQLHGILEIGRREEGGTRMSATVKLI